MFFPGFPAALGFIEERYLGYIVDIQLIKMRSFWHILPLLWDFYTEIWLHF